MLLLPKRRTRLHLVRTFVCHRSVNTCEPLARENTFQPKLRSALIARLQMPQILPAGGGHHTRGGFSDFQLSGETAAAQLLALLTVVKLAMESSELKHEERGTTRFLHLSICFGAGTPNKSGSQGCNFDVVDFVGKKDKTLFVRLLQRKKKNDYELRF